MVLLEQELPECNRIDKVNELAEKFCTNHGTSKSSRKRMQQSLFSIPRSRLDLIPYYSRIAATFDRVFPDIADQLVVELEKQFHGLARWKKQQNLDNRIRNARVSFYCKFGLIEFTLEIFSFTSCHYVKRLLNFTVYW